MTLSFRPDMKTIVHEVDGHAVTVAGKTISATSSTVLAMMDAGVDAERFRVGAKIRCSYVDPGGVHEFRTVVAGVEGLALNHRLLRLSFATPTSAERMQRRNYVRAPVELPVLVDDLKDGQYACTMVDLSAGGVAVIWPDDIEVIDAGAMVEVRFRSERFDHFHVAQALGPYPVSKQTVVRLRFEGITNAERDRLATVVAAAQREALKRQKESSHR